MSSFVFIVATSDYNTHISYICPIINTDSTFTDLSSNKLRPALVLVESDLDLTLSFITTQIKWKEDTDIE